VSARSHDYSRRGADACLLLLTSGRSRDLAGRTTSHPKVVILGVYHRHDLE